jgi:hypothetical protein
LVSEYLRRDNLQALPASQRSLMTLVLRKLLASSTFAIAGALETMSQRLRVRLQQDNERHDLEEELNEDFEAFDEMAEEWGEETTAPEPLSTSERTALTQEIADLESFRALAVSITHNAKGEALLTALQTAFVKAEALGAARKAIVFTDLPNHDARKTIWSASLRIAPTRTASYYSTAQTMTKSPARSCRLAGAPHRHRSRDWLTQRGYAVGTGRLFP